jgi:hypothetical protein
VVRFKEIGTPMKVIYEGPLGTNISLDSVLNVKENNFITSRMFYAKATVFYFKVEYFAATPFMIDSEI